MARTLPGLLQSEIYQEVVRPFFAVDIDFDVRDGTDVNGNPITYGPLYMWSGYGNITINGKLYLGAGQIMNISSVEETTEMEAKGASITVTGIPSSFLSIALQEPYQGRECRIYFGMIVQEKSIVTQDDDNIVSQDVLQFITQSGVSAEYLEIFSGELDQMNISESGDTATISVTAENILIKLERPVVRRFTEEDQKTRYPADKGLEFVNALQDREIYWGRKSS